MMRMIVSMFTSSLKCVASVPVVGLPQTGVPATVTRAIVVNDW
jgi:hypothetical protein